MVDYNWVIGDDAEVAHCRLIDSGYSGHVHEMYNNRTHKAFARKVLRPFDNKIRSGDIKSEVRIVKILCTTEHKNIVSVLKVGNFEKSPFYFTFIDMELCELNLDVYIKRRWDDVLRAKVPDLVDVDDMSLESRHVRICGIMKDIANGVAFIHSKELVHRDLKPQNAQAWKIADFGFTVEGTSQGEYKSSEARGTAGYRAPELLNGRVFNNKVDIWAMGCLLFEIIFVQKLFPGDYAVNNQGINIPAGNELCDPSSSLAKLIHEMVHVDPLKRPRAEDLVGRFDSVFDEDRLRGQTLEDRSPLEVPVTRVVEEVNSIDQPRLGQFYSHLRSHSEEDLDIEYVDYLAVNEPNTHIGAMVVIKSKRQDNNSTIQLRLWDASSGQLLWYRHSTNDYVSVPFTFGANGRYLCFRDDSSISVVDTLSPSLSETSIFKLPLNQTKDLSSFEFNLVTSGLIAFAVSRTATRIALAAPNRTTSTDVKFNAVRNTTHMPAQLAQFIDQVDVPISVSSATLNYASRRDVLFTTSHDKSGVVLTSFSLNSKQTLTRVAYNWNRPGDLVDGIRVYGVTSINNDDCLILTIPAKVKTSAHSLWSSSVAGRAAVIVSASGQKIAKLMSFPGKASQQSHDITICDGKIILCLWKKGRGRIYVWDKKGFSKSHRFTYSSANRGFRIAYRDGRLTMISPTGELEIVNTTSTFKLFKFTGRGGKPAEG